MEKNPHIVWDDVEMFHIDTFLPLIFFRTFAEKWIKSDTVLYITARTHLTGRARLLYRLKPI